MSLKQVLGENVSALRRAKGLSQNELAELADTSYVHVSRIENGHSWPSDDLIERLAKALKVSAPELFFDSKNAAFPPDVVDRIADLARSVRLKVSR